MRLNVRLPVQINIFSLLSKRFYAKIGRDCTMKVLNVAEKNDAAKNIAGHLSRGRSQRREGFSPYNKIYEFQASAFNQNVTMIMTSVSGHLMNFEFVGTYRSWTKCNPLELFHAPVQKACQTEDYEKIKRTLEREVRGCSTLIIWTDCDREGENIGFEIISVCLAVKPGLKVYRAKFSEITGTSVQRAMRNLIPPDQRVSDAVDVRQELDLRIGAAFTRLQTLRLKQVFPTLLSNNLISYGSCQFPTLGFVVDRYKAIENFIPQNFWRLKMQHTQNDLTVDFAWGRDRLFDRNNVLILLEECQDNPTATVMSVVSKPKSKWRPLPLDTVEMEKTVSRKLKINAKTTMKIAEKLYNQGLISYPRTETNIFPKEINLTTLIEHQANDNTWGTFARNILDNGGPTPRSGNKSDQAHPPIHPIKHADNLNGDDKRLYEFIVRHFLACCSKDAKGFETIVDVEISREKFQAKGLMITERNYLDIYIYDKWNAKEVHIYQEGQQFQPSLLDMVEGTTTAPPLLTEADLIALMEKHGIGTDATHADHISTIQQREYVALPDGQHFVPGLLGMGLVEGYDQIGLNVSLAKPHLRAELESELKKICNGEKDPKVVLEEQVNKYYDVYRKVLIQLNLIDDAIGVRLNEQPTAVSAANDVANFASANIAPSPFKCPKCGFKMTTKRRENDTWMIGCSAYPSCNNAIWLPAMVKNVCVLDEECEQCGSEFKKVNLEFLPSTFGFYASPHVGCFGGCDPNLNESFNVNLSSVRNRGNSSIQSSNVSNTTLRTLNRPEHTRNNSISNQHIQHVTNDSGFNGSTNHINDEVSWGRGSSGNDTIDASAWSSSRNTDIGTSRNGSGGNPRSRNVVRGAGGTGSGHDIVCGCNAPALLLTVRKSGPNQGRQFYKCAKSRDNGGCDFFLWAPDDAGNDSSLDPFNGGGGGPGGGPGSGPGGGPGSGPGRPTHPTNTWTSPTSNDSISCDCGNPAKRLVVRKETQNKGREFFSCAKPQGSGSCNFFKWADEVADGAAGTSNQNESWSRPSTSTGSRGAQKRTFTKSGFSSNGKVTKKRKCGYCGEEGHIRTKCPNNQSSHT